MTPLRSELEKIILDNEMVIRVNEDGTMTIIAEKNPKEAISSLEALIEKREKALMHEIIDLHNEPGFGTDFDGIAEEVIKRAGYKAELRGDTP